MTSYASLLASFVLVLGALQVFGASSAREARQRAFRWALLGFLISVAILVAALNAGYWTDAVPADEGLFSQGRYLLVAACVNSLIGSIAIALSPLTSHRPGTFARILLLIAVAGAFLGTTNPLALVVMWLGSAAVAYAELRSRSALVRERKLFAAHHALSGVLFLLGPTLFVLGKRQEAMLVFLLAIALREAVAPFHGWLVSFVERAPMGLVVAFVTPQLGVYAHLELFRHASAPELAHWVGGVGAISALFGAFLALGQVKVRRAAAYLVMSQTGLVAFGLENQSAMGWTGAVLTWLVSALGISAFLLCLANLAARRGELILWETNGDPAQLPRLGAATLLSGLATVGAPFTLGFVAEDLLLQGSIAEHPILGLALIVVTALNGMTVMRIYFGLFTAGRHRGGERDVKGLELTALSVVLCLLVLGGLFPGLFVTWIR